MGRTLEEKRNNKDNDQGKKSQEKQSPVKIIFNCFISCIVFIRYIYSLYWFFECRAIRRNISKIYRS